MLIKIAKWIYRIYRNHYKRKFSKCSKDLRFFPHNSYFTYSKIEIGINVFINKHAYFSGMVTIGNNVLFGPYVFITDGYHKYNEIGKTIEEQGDGEKQRIFIDDDVWVGAKTSIMRGVHIYEGTIIGTGSIVTKNMPPYCVCAGFPCKPIKLRYTDDELRIHYLKRNQNIDNAEKLISLRREILNQLKSNLLKNEEV